MSLVKKPRLDNGTSGLLILTNGQTLWEGIVLDANTGGSLLSGRFSDDGNLIATAGTDKLINIWTCPFGDSMLENTMSIGGHKSAITSLQWSHDNLMIFTSSADKTAGIWDIETGLRIRKLKGHQLVVNQVSGFQQSGTQFVVSCSDDGRLLLWDMREKFHVKEFKTEYPLLTCCINNSGNTLYAAGIEATVYAIDLLLDFEKPLWTSQVHQDYITSLSISEDDQILVSRSNDGTIRSYNSKSYVANNDSRARPGIFHGSISSYDNLIRCKLSANYLISGSDDKHLTIWDFQSRKLLKKLGGSIGSVLDVDYHPERKLLLSTSSEGTCIIRNFSI